jgi:hypothetical protein
MKSKFLFFIFSIHFFSYILYSGSSGEQFSYETQFLVNKPTASSISFKSEIFSLNFSGNSNFVLNGEYSPFENFSVGLAFGGNNFFGKDKVIFQSYPGILLKYRFINENKYIPAIAIGFNSQGYGNFNEKLKEFEINSPGFYLVLSKSFKWKYGYVAWHLGANYSFEPASNLRKINPYLGFEHTLGKRSSLNFEYDFQSPYNPNFVLSKSIYNISLRYSIDMNTTLELKFVDLFHTNSDLQRLLKVEFIGYFF